MDYIAESSIVSLYSNAAASIILHIYTAASELSSGNRNASLICARAASFDLSRARAGFCTADAPHRFGLFLDLSLSGVEGKWMRI